MCKCFFVSLALLAAIVCTSAECLAQECEASESKTVCVVKGKEGCKAGTSDCCEEGSKSCTAKAGTCKVKCKAKGECCPPKGGTCKSKCRIIKAGDGKCKAMASCCGKRESKCRVFKVGTGKGKGKYIKLNAMKGEGKNEIYITCDDCDGKAKCKHIDLDAIKGDGKTFIYTMGGEEDEHKVIKLNAMGKNGKCRILTPGLRKGAATCVTMKVDAIEEDGVIKIITSGDCDEEVECKVMKLDGFGKDGTFKIVTSGDCDEEVECKVMKLDGFGKDGTFKIVTSGDCEGLGKCFKAGECEVEVFAEPECVVMPGACKDLPPGACKIIKLNAPEGVEKDLIIKIGDGEGEFKVLKLNDLLGKCKAGTFKLDKPPKGIGKLMMVPKPPKPPKALVHKKRVEKAIEDLRGEVQELRKIVKELRKRVKKLARKERAEKAVL